MHHTSANPRKNPGKSECFLSENDEAPRNNGVVLNIAQIIKVIMMSEVEEELGAMYVNSHKTLSQTIALIKMGYPQPKTPNADQKLGCTLSCN